MHRTGVDGAFDDRIWFAGAQIFRRVGDELRAAAGRAKIVIVPAMFGPVFGRMRIDAHPADGVDRPVRRRVHDGGRVSRSRLASDTPRGYIASMAKDNKAATLKRLNRIEGQVRGLARMVEGDRYCIDIVTQIGAVRAALRRVEEEILRDHVAHCVDHAIKSGDKADQRRKVAELMDVMGRAAR